MFETSQQLLRFSALAFTPGLSVLVVFYATSFLASRADGAFEMGFLIFVSLVSLMAVMASLPLYCREASRQVSPGGLLQHDFREELWEDDEFFPSEDVVRFNTDQGERRKVTREK